ncbi:MAG: three-Cys-motif partner protein TcmP [Candidatus Cloacimonadales bacterium]|jgi:three-Cys-motif partner protein|nr:three-Cys-motif partner protein TcmP [Acholeplasmataceae bacterium]MDX9977620.1 three-Cys-motif partner protein TcmP [Candidatus Cloacimonadales bacterium]
MINENIKDLRYWKIEDHTKIKHLTVNEYLDKWIKILGDQYTPTIFDCYGGNGLYKDVKDIEHFGSPLLISRRIKENYLNLKRKTNFFVIEKDKKTFDSLSIALKREKLDKYCCLINDDFNVIYDDLLQNKASEANLFFIDPFGYNIDFKILKKIMEKGKSEIILNFMFNSINRYIGVKSVHETIDRLYDCSEWRDFISLTGIERENSIISLYKDQCKNIAKFVLNYRICFPDKDRTYYYLIHLTNHIKGAKIMKSCFAQFNDGRIEYLGKRKDQLTIFDLKHDHVKEYLMNTFKGKEQTFDNIIDILIDKCPYLECDIRNAIKKLENEKMVSINRRTSKTSKGLSGEDLIMFVGF